MSDDAQPPAVRRWPHILRLVLFMALLVTMFYLVAVARVIDVERIRDAVAETGPIAPLTYLLVAAVLAAIFVPGPLLAAGSGFLFGPLLGTFVTLGSTVTTAMIAALVGRRAGRDSARALIGPQWSQRIDGQIKRRGLWAVVGQRFIPGISDALASYAFGAFGIPLWQMAIGAFIGSAPRAFVYTALGASISDLSSPLAYAAIGVWCVTAIIGAFAAHRGYRSWRAGTDNGAVADRNVLGDELQPCGTEPLTGFYRDGCCSSGPEDIGLHTICAVVTAEFLEHQRSIGNDLSTPIPQFRFPGLAPGDRWCVTARNWLRAHQDGCAAPVVLACTHERTLELVPLETLQAYAVDVPDDIGGLP